MSNIEAIRTLMERADKISPSGGRKLALGELKALSKEERAELGALAAAELGETVTA